MARLEIPTQLEKQYKGFTLRRSTAYQGINKTFMRAPIHNVSYWQIILNGKIEDRALTLKSARKRVEIILSGAN